MKYTQQQINDAIQQLKDCGVTNNSRIYTTIRSVARSGMSRTISFFTISENKLLNITYAVGVLTNNPLTH